MTKPAFCLTAAFLLVGAYSPAPSHAQSEFTAERMPYEAFDKLVPQDLIVGGSKLHVAFAPGDFALPKENLLAWIEKSATAVATYYGRFPVAPARILIVPIEGRGVRGGQAFGYRGAAVRLLVGRASTQDDLVRDWKAVHEMAHLALPDMDEAHTWLSEGLAVYVESIARVQAGDLTAEKIWAEFIRDMPNGLPEPGDNGLDYTHTWGRTYWGGAIFCLLADIEFRRQTGNKKGLQDAMRGVIAAGGSLQIDWPIERVLAVADEAGGAPVLAKLYRSMRAAPEPQDLDALWRDLGIVGSGGSVRFDDNAPLAAIRRAITKRP